MPHRPPDDASHDHDTHPEPITDGDPTDQPDDDHPLPPADIEATAADHAADALDNDDLKACLTKIFADAIRDATHDAHLRIGILEKRLEAREAHNAQLRRNLGELMHALSDVAADELPENLTAYAADTPAPGGEDCPLHAIADDGPFAVIESSDDIYPVHHRAASLIEHIALWGRHAAEADVWAVHIGVPVARQRLEALRDESLSSTQMKRVFEQVVEWGQDCEHPPEIRKNETGVRELIVYNPPKPPEE